MCRGTSSRLTLSGWISAGWRVPFLGGLCYHCPMPKTDGKSLLAAAETALTAWDLRPDKITLASVSENIVFRVDTPSGEAFVLRLHRPGYHSLAALEAEQQWTAALNRAGIGAPIPRPTADGRRYTEVALPHRGETRFAGLAEWVEGVAMGAVMADERDESVLLGRFRQVGQMAARIHNQASGWPLPPGFQRHSFDADGLMGDRPFWGRFWEIPQLSPGERALILHGRRAIHRLLSAQAKSPATYSLIHADLHPGNLILAGDRVHVIDFDDSGFGWHQYELAVALFYNQDDPRYDAIGQALVAGYRAVRPLSDAALALLPVFVLIRGLALLGWIHDRPELKYEYRLPGLIARVCGQIEGLFPPVA